MSSLILGILETTNEPPAGLKVAQARKGLSTDMSGRVG
jgi:hypothetical protein